MIYHTNNLSKRLKNLNNNKTWIIYKIKAKDINTTLILSNCQVILTQIIN